MLHHDNAPAHTSLVCEFLAKHEMTVVPQSPYSPDLAPADFFVHKVEIHSERSLISDDRRKFATGPTHYPAKPITELEKTLEVVYRQ
jgi:transposase